MSTSIQRRRGTTAQHSSFTGANGEITIDTDKEVVVVHDGATAGGYPAMRENGSNSALALGSAATPSLKFTGDTNTGLYSPGADQVAISTGGTRRLLIDSTGALTLDTGDATINNIRVGRGGGAITSNTALGAAALNANTTGNNSTALGFEALTTNTTGFGNAADGYQALRNNTTGAYNTAIGAAALKNNTTGYTNTAIGQAALTNNTTGENNTCLGATAGQDLTTGSNNTIIGRINGTAGLSGTVIIGAGSTERLRIDSSGRLGLGTSSALYTFDCRGQGAFELFNTSGGGNVLNFRPSLEDANKYNMSISSYDHSGNGTGNADGLSINGFDGVSICTGNSTGRTERLRVTQAGLVGIGTTSPGSALAVAGDIRAQINSGYGTTKFSFFHSGAEFGYTSVDTNAGRMYLNSSYNIELQPGGTSKAAFTSTGRLGVNMTNPAATLDVNGDITNSAAFGCYYLSSAATSASSPAYSFYGDSNTGFFRPGADEIGVSTGGSERARIDSSGRLLVGTSTALSTDFSGSALLQVVKDANNAAQVFAFSSAGQDYPAALELGRGRGTKASPSSALNGDWLGNIDFLGHNGTQFHVGARITAIADAEWNTSGDTTDTPTRLVFSTTADGASSPTERMRINNAGRTCIFSSAASVIDVASSSTAGTTNVLIQGVYLATNTTDGTASFRVYTNGNVQNTNNSYGAISDIKLKENVVDASSQWADLKALQVRNYNFKEGQTHTQIGLVAQEVELVSPGLVSESPDRDAEGNDLGTVTKSVNYSVLYMKAVKALQEAMERIEQLETEMAEVKAQLQAS